MPRASITPAQRCTALHPQRCKQRQLAASDSCQTGRGGLHRERCAPMGRGSLQRAEGQRERDDLAAGRTTQHRLHLN